MSQHQSNAQTTAGNIITQNPRDFAVQIRKCSDAETIIGTGVAVSMDGTIVTCAHVVRDAVGAAPCEANDVDVPVYFPQVRGGETQLRNARIAGCFPEHDDDVVLLQLTDGPAPLAPEQIAKVGAAAASFMNPFVSYGFRALPPYNAGFARGTVMGCVDCPPDRVLLTDPVQLDSKHISGGMSGSPVLDQERNLVIGIVSETYYTPEDKDRDTAWAVDAHVLSFDPLNLSVQDAPQPKRTTPQPQPLPDPRMALLRPRNKVALHGAPPLLDEWVGRDDLLNALDDDWASDTPHVTTLIGFGGEGKSSLARKWLSRALRSTNSERVLDGVFWWSFYDEPSVESFFEAVLEFLSGGQIDSRQYRSASAKGHLIAGLMAGGRYLFVLDGFEVMQHNEDDSYGLVRSNDLRAFLEYAAAPGHASFCLITSRAPVLDLLPYTTATQRDVTRLSEADGRALLRAVGVNGLDDDLDRAVQAWDGHALTLSLLGTYLAEHYGGDIAHLDDIPTPASGALTADEPRYERVHRVLRRYDEHLTDAEREFLTLFSAFRTPVGLDAFNRVFRVGASLVDALPANAESVDTPESGQPQVGRPQGSPLRMMDDAAFAAMVARLMQYRLLRHIAQNDTYTTHPLVRAHYYTLFTQGSDAADAHTHIKNYYLEVARDTPHYPTLNDLQALIEVVYHACQAEAYNEAYEIYRE